MLPQSQPRKRRNSSKVNLMISLVFHSLIIGALIYFAARQGFLGKHLKKIAVEMVKEKAPEKPKVAEKPKPKPEQPKPETRKMAQAPKVEAPKETATPAPPPTETAAAPPAVAPPPAEMPSFVFGGGKTVQTSSDPIQLYKGLVEYAVRSNWKRPENLKDDYIAEVKVKVDHSGDISDPVWIKNSGSKAWDNSVRAAIAATRNIDRSPPTNFPPEVLVRFDVQDETEPLLQ